MVYVLGDSKRNRGSAVVWRRVCGELAACPSSCSRSRSLRLRTAMPGEVSGGGCGLRCAMGGCRQWLCRRPQKGWDIVGNLGRRWRSAEHTTYTFPGNGLLPASFCKRPAANRRSRMFIGCSAPLQLRHINHTALDLALCELQISSISMFWFNFDSIFGPMQKRWTSCSPLGHVPLVLTFCTYASPIALCHTLLFPET